MLPFTLWNGHELELCNGYVVVAVAIVAMAFDVFPPDAMQKSTAYIKICAVIN